MYIRAMEDIRKMSQFRLPQKTRDELAKIAKGGSMTDALIEAVSAYASGNVYPIEQPSGPARQHKTQPEDYPRHHPESPLYGKAPREDRAPIFGGMLKAPKKS